MLHNVELCLVAVDSEVDGGDRVAGGDDAVGGETRLEAVSANCEAGEWQSWLDDLVIRVIVLGGGVGAVDTTCVIVFVV